MATKKSFALRIDGDIYDALEKWAADDFRSINGQIEWLLNEALKKQKRHPSQRSRATKKETPPEENK